MSARQKSHVVKPRPAAESSRFPWATVLQIAAFFILAFIAFWPSVSNGFIWDDDVMLTSNELMKAPDGLRRIWTTMELSDYFPLTSTMLWIEWRIWGMNAIGYNVANILLHLSSGILLWRILVRLKIPGAWLAGILFTIHPVCVESVDWIAERKNTLSMVFYLSALLLYLRFEQHQQRRFYWFALGTFLLALLSKTSVVVLPMVLLLCAWWQRGQITGLDFRRSLPFFGVAFVLGMVTVWFQLHEVLLGEIPVSEPLMLRVLGGSWAVWFYLYKALLPVKLCMIYPRWHIQPGNLLMYLPAVFWFGLLTICWLRRQTWGRPFFFALCYFWIALSPVLGILPMDFLRFSQVADHLQYIALPGMVALAVGVSAVLVQRNFTRSTMIVATISPILVFCVLTWRQSSVYDNEETLWRDTIRKNPTAWIGYHNLADTLAERHRFEEAMVYYQKAIALRPEHAKSHNNLGNCLHITGRFDDAIDEFLKAIQDKPEMAEAHNNLGIAYYHKGDYQKALECFNKAIQFKPDYAAAYQQAGNTCFKLGDLDRALDNYFSAARYNPDSADIQYNLGIVLELRGQTNAAVASFKHALKLDPKNKPAAEELHLLLASTDPQK